MNSEALREALFEEPLTEVDLGSMGDFGRLAALSALRGENINVTAEKAAIREMAAILGVSEEEAYRLLRGLKSRSENPA